MKPLSGKIPTTRMGSSDWTAGAAACSASVPAPEEAAAGAAAVGADSLPPKLQLDKALARAEVPIKASCFCRRKAAA